MKRFIQRNRSKIIVLCLLVVCMIIGLSAIRISSIDDTRQENAVNASIEDIVAVEPGDRSPGAAESFQDGLSRSGSQAGNDLEDRNLNNPHGASGDSSRSHVDSDGNNNNYNNPDRINNNIKSNQDTGNQSDRNNGNNNGNGNTSNNNNNNSNNTDNNNSNSNNNNSSNGNWDNNRTISDGSGQGQDEYRTDPVDEGKPEPVNREDQTVTDESFTVYLSIDCKTLLDHMDSLDESLKKYVGDGIILERTPVKCYSGESVWDVLIRECKARGINLESADTPVYGSEYVEAINNLGEFDCGELSGWCYSVNGWFPNYGASRYVLVEGETIEWRYTCDLGRDVGSEWK
ncbi:MAG: DUF4430 domain-containing protein [Eubacterium sp.]|nr:DUF4430 domain-containing protein [Eubacterium sp.]